MVPSPRTSTTSINVPTPEMSPAPDAGAAVNRNDLTATLTARWEVRWELSNRQSGRDPDITTSTSFPYDVYEVQTVGTG